MESIFRSWTVTTPHQAKKKVLTAMSGGLRDRELERLIHAAEDSGDTVQADMLRALLRHGEGPLRPPLDNRSFGENPNEQQL